MQTNNQNTKDLFREALQPVTDHRAKIKRKQYKPEFARFKLKFYWRDGNSSVHYSYDFLFRYTDGVRRTVTDEQLGYSKLVQCIHKNKDLYITAVIWANVSNDISTDTGTYDVEVLKSIRNRDAKVNPLMIFRHDKLELDPLIISHKKQIR